jgi:hypothetical protein
VHGLPSSTPTGDQRRDDLGDGDTEVGDGDAWSLGLPGVRLVTVGGRALR